MNIFELDAASNNSVDDIRNLVDQVRYAPQSGDYKIYIIDEVHMLSTPAFNAFLKTLEEPPSYAIFILATTEKHKIIPTILSRCQIFDFNRITIEDIAQHLAWVAQNENINAEPEALHMIAQKADGALRDALSIFDQIVSFAGNNITYRHVIDNLNILDYEYFFKITDFIHAGDFVNSLLLLNEIINEGFDVHHFISGLSAHCRDLLVSQDIQTIPLLEVSETTRTRYKAQSKLFTPDYLFKMLEIGNRCDVDFKSAQNQRLHVELALLKMCNLKSGNEGKNTVQITETSTTEKKIPVVTNKTNTSNTILEKAPTTPVEVQKTKATPAPEQVAVTSPTQTTSSGISSVSRNRITGNSTVSITKKMNAVKPVLEIREEIIETGLPNQPLEHDAVINAVKELVEKLQTEGRKQLATTLNKHQPKLLENGVIEIAVDNPIQAGEIQDNRTELLGYLKKKLMNGNVDLFSRVMETGEGTFTAYTPAEKFSKMAEKNPDLNQLRQQFDLELDF